MHAGQSGEAGNFCLCDIEGDEYLDAGVLIGLHLSAG